MQCPTCAQAELVPDTRDLSYNYNGKTTMLAHVTGDFCPVCGESIHDSEESVRISACMIELYAQSTGTA